MSAVPEIGGRQPLAIDVEAGKSYWWCACGRSKKQPFCDGSHKQTEFRPVEWSQSARAVLKALDATKDLSSAREPQLRLHA